MVSNEPSAEAVGPCPNCGHELADHAESDHGPHTVCVQTLDTFPDGGFHGVCPCVLAGDHMRGPSAKAIEAAADEFMLPDDDGAEPYLATEDARRRWAHALLKAAYRIDAPAIHAAGVAEGRAAMRDEMLTALRVAAPSDSGLTPAAAAQAAAFLWAAFPTTGGQTDG